MDQELRVAGLHSGDDVAQDGDAGGVVPVMQDGVQVVRSRAWGGVSRGGLW